MYVNGTVLGIGITNYWTITFYISGNHQLHTISCMHIFQNSNCKVLFPSPLSIQSIQGGVFMGVGRLGDKNDNGGDDDNDNILVGIGVR